jgi:hypothetical protein
MTCGNIAVSFFALIILALSLWPNLVPGSNWIIGIASVLIIAGVWGMCNCKYCSNVPQKANKSKKKSR